MRAETKDFLDNLLKVPWFSNLGEPVTENATPVKSLREAKKMGTARKWENFKLAPMNRLSDLLWDRDDITVDETDEIAESVNRAVFAIFEDQPEKVFGELILDEDIRCIVLADVQVAAFEVEYSHLIKPLFNLPILWPWYERGHLPCGWDGKMISEDWAGNGPEDLPEGRLRVF